MSVSEIAGIVLVFATILLLPIALFLRQRRIVLATLGVSVLLAFVVLAGNYFWPVLALPLASLALLARSSPEADDESDAAPQPTTLGSQPTTLGSQPTTLGSQPTTLGTAIVVGLVLVAGWFLFFLPELRDVVPILPADSPADTFSRERIARDFSANAMSAWFALPWLGMLMVGVAVRSVPRRAVSRKAGSRK